MHELLADEHLAFLINLYHYFGTGSHLKMFTQEEVKSNLLELPEWVLLNRGFLSVTPVKLTEVPQNRIPANYNSECLLAYVQITDAGLRCIITLLEDEPVRGIRLYIDLFHLSEAVFHVKQLSYRELPEFLVHGYCVIREAAYFRSRELELIYQLPGSR